MSSPVFTTDVDGSMMDVVGLMKEHEISGVVMVDVETRPAGIITKKDLLEALIKQASLEERKGIQIQLAGNYGDTDDFDMGHIRNDVEGLSYKMEKMFEYGWITLHFKKIKDTRKDSRRYLIRMLLIAPKKVYAAHHEGFNVLEVMQVLMDKIERVIISYKECARDEKRLQEYLTKYELWM